MADARVARGRATQRLLAEHLKVNGWPYAESRGSSEPGSDLTGTPGLDIEVKATSKGPILGAIRQARLRAPDGVVPVAIWRPNGYGPERIGDWVLALSLTDGLALLRAAGYGT